MTNDIKLIGIGGLPRSGKDFLAEVYIENGFYGVSMGDIVRDKARIRHANTPDPISIANMTETSNWLREQNGSEFALIECLERYKKAQELSKFEGLVVFSVRMAVEVDFILANGGKVIWMEADDSVRYQRYIQHMREGEIAISQAELMAQEALQWQPQPGIDPSIQMDIEYVKSHATDVFENNINDVQDFTIRANKFIAETT